MKRKLPVCPLITVAAALGLMLSASAAADQAVTSTASAASAKPAWVTDFSLGVKESYDNNVFLSDVGKLAHRDSWITTVSPKVGVNFAPLLPDQQILRVLALGYAPDFAIYHNEPTESYDAHRLAQTVKAKTDAFSLDADNAFNYIDGSTAGPIYPDGRSAIATGAPRERREQYQDKGKFAFQYDQKDWFVRPTASLLYYDLMTALHNASGAFKGYDNYADRYDVNGGVDFGYKLQPQLALTLGYRYGHQYQQQYPTNIDTSKLSASSDYQRLLLGVEGKPLKWLTVALQGGPDFRDYAPTTKTHTAPVNDLHPIKYYGEAAITAEISTSDSLTFKYRQWQWVASTGKLPYFDSLYDLSYRHKFTKALSLDLGGRIQSSDYTSGNASASLRDDWQYTVSAGVNYAFNAHVSATLGYQVDLGRNAEDDLTPTTVASREYDRHLVTLGFLIKL